VRLFVSKYVVSSHQVYGRDGLYIVEKCIAIVKEGVCVCVCVLMSVHTCDNMKRMVRI